MSDKLVSIETVKGLFRLIPANMPFDIAECLLNERLNALPAVPHEMTAREYEKALARAFSSADDAYGEWSDAIDEGNIDKAVAIIEKWAREHLEERSEDNGNS